MQTDEKIHLQDAMIIFGGRNDTRKLIKQAIIKYGPVTVGYSILPMDYNKTDYIDKELQPVHYVPIIGWDDNYPAENFIDTQGVLVNPPKNKRRMAGKRF